MSTIHFIGGEKGGVGKSVVARTFTQYLIDRQLPFTALDADTSHGALMRHYEDYSHPVNLETFSSADAIMDGALGSDRRVVVDLPAQSHRFMERWLTASDVLSFAKEMSVQLVFWHVSDGGFDSVNELGRLFDTFGSKVEYVIVKNHGRSSDFSQLEQSEVTRSIVDGDGDGRCIEMPPLDGQVMYKLDRFGSSFWAAVNAPSDQSPFSAMERRRAQRWLNSCYSELDKLGALL